MLNSHVWLVPTILNSVSLDNSFTEQVFLESYCVSDIKVENMQNKALLLWSVASFERNSK